jgi:hypothetical protein
VTPVERDATRAPAPATTPTPAAPRVAPAPVAPRTAPGTERVAPGVDTTVPAAPAAPAPDRLRFGTPPTPEEELFKPRRPDSEVESVLPIGKALPLPFDAAKKAGPEVGRADARKGVLNLFPPPPEKETKLARDIGKAAQPDCRDAYAALGLLAVPFLLKDALTDAGCRW